MVAKSRALAGGSAAGMLLIALGACGKGSLTKPDLIDPTKTGDAFEGVQCQSIRPPTEPDLMGWDAGSRAKLKSLHDEGVVAVRYKAEGCNVELELLNCVGEGQYRFSAYSASETKTAKSQQELYTKLPIGAAELGGKVGGGQALRTDYLLAGMKKLGVMRSYPASKLRGNCDRATHVVSTLYIGGFAMAAGESETIGASATVFGAGGELSSDRSAERLVEEGNAEACQQAQAEGKEVPLCSVPLRVGLTPIEGRAEGSCPQGSSWDGEGCVKKEVATPAPAPPSNPPSVAKVAPRPTPTPPPRPSPRSVAPSSGSCPSGMAWVSGGSFQMGSNTGAGDEKPVHRASVRGFCLDRTEVTVAAYKRCVDGGSCSKPRTGKFYNWGMSGKGNHPINGVDWNQAKAYCEAQGKRLPTETEWEYAARGTSSRKYPWGSSAPSSSRLCWNRYDSEEGTCEVGQFSSGDTPEGIHDLAGNVWEWTASRYCNYPSKACDNADRVVRGGGWVYDVPSRVRGAVRSWYAPPFGSDLGFRCAR